ncbi:MAG: hypothetical protein ACKVS5_06805 [Parvularculaceae bacterium]
MRALQILLQLIGGVTLLAAAALVAFGISNDEVRFSDDDTPAKTGVVRLILNWSGLDDEQDYKVVHSFRSVVSPLGDYIDYHCLQVEKFSPDARIAPTWVVGPEKDAIMAQARDLFSAAGKLGRCFGDGVEANDQTTAFFVHNLELNRSHDLSVDEPHITGGEVIFFHQPTNRLLYVGFET